jgi:hypothetical protein
MILLDIKIVKSAYSSVKISMNEGIVTWAPNSSISSPVAITTTQFFFGRVRKTFIKRYCWRRHVCLTLGGFS